MMLVAARLALHQCVTGYWLRGQVAAGLCFSVGQMLGSSSWNCLPIDIVLADRSYS